MNKRISFLLIFCLLICFTFNFANATLTTIYSEDFQDETYNTVPTSWTVISGGEHWKVHNCDYGDPIKTYRNDFTTQADEISTLNITDIWKAVSYELKANVRGRSNDGNDKAEMLLFYKDGNNYVRLQMYSDKIVINERIGGSDNERGYWFYNGSGSPGGSGSSWSWSIDKWYTLKANLEVYSTYILVKFSIWDGESKKSECSGRISRYNEGKFGLSCWGTKTCFDDIVIKSADVINVSFGIPLVYPSLLVNGDISAGSLLQGTTAYNLGVTTVTVSQGIHSAKLKVAGQDNSATYDFASDNPANNQYVLKMKQGSPSSNWVDYSTLISTGTAQTLIESLNNGELYFLSAIWLGPIMNPGNIANQATITFSVSE